MSKRRGVREPERAWRRRRRRRKRRRRERRRRRRSRGRGRSEVGYMVLFISTMSA